MGSIRLWASRGRPLRPVTLTPPLFCEGDVKATGLQGLNPAVLAELQPRRNVDPETPTRNLPNNTLSQQDLEKQSRQKHPHMLRRRHISFASKERLIPLRICRSPREKLPAPCFCHNSVNNWTRTSTASRPHSSRQMCSATRCNTVQHGQTFYKTPDCCPARYALPGRILF